MWFSLSLAYLLGAVAGHAVLCRLPVPGNVVVKFLLVGGALGLGLVGHGILLYGPRLETWTAALLFAFASELYIFLFTLVSSSVSVALLLKLRVGSLTKTQIDALYDSCSMVEGRIEKLLANGLLRQSAAGYALTHKGRVLLTVFGGLRRLFGHAPVPSSLERLAE